MSGQHSHLSVTCGAFHRVLILDLQVIDVLSLRRGELADMVPAPGGRQRLTFTAPSRGLIGFKSGQSVSQSNNRVVG
jgi:predicted membrane GTPase involved in stress response